MSCSPNKCCHYNFICFNYNGNGDIILTISGSGNALIGTNASKYPKLQGCAVIVFLAATTTRYWNWWIAPLMRGHEYTDYKNVPSILGYFNHSIFY